MLESTANKTAGLTYVVDMEPFYVTLYNIISKYLVVEKSPLVLIAPNGYIGLPGSCSVQNSEQEPAHAWDGVTTPALRLLDLKGNVQWDARVSKKPLVMQVIMNRFVFNFFAHVLETHFLRDSCKWAGPKEYSTIWNYYHTYVNKDNLRINPDQQQFLNTALVTSQQRANEEIQNEIRRNFLKSIPMTETECINRISTLQQAYYLDAVNAVLNDNDTSTRMIELYDDLILWARKNLPHYFQLNDTISDNPWGVFEITVANRTGRNNNLVVYYHGDFRILQWESEHLSKYQDKHE